MVVHTETRSRSRTGSAVLLAAAVAGLAAPPVVLARVVGWPLPRGPVDLATVAEAVRLGLVPSGVWINAVALVAWVSWMVLGAMLAVEVVAVMADRPSSRAVPDWIRRIAQVLVSATLTLSVPTYSALSGAAAIVPSVVVAADAPTAAAPVDTPVGSQATPVGTRLAMVADGDSWAGFAEAELGDASMGPQLRQLNAGRRVDGQSIVTADVAFVEPGWTLLVPTVSRIGAAQGGTAVLPGHDVNGRAATVAASNERGAQGGRRTAEQAQSWTVERGDHMWKIAETTLEETWDRTVTDEEVTPYWRSVIEANEDNLLPPGDPNLIYPGQDLDVPPVPPDHADLPTDAEHRIAEPNATPPPEHDRPVGDASEAARQPTADDRAARAAATPSTQTPHRSASEFDPSDEPSRPRASSFPRPAGPPHRASDDRRRSDGERFAGAADNGSDRTVWGVPSGLAASAAAASFAAAGVAELLRRRRRQAARQRPVGLRLPTPAPGAADALDRLSARAADPRKLETLAVMLETVAPADSPSLITTSDDGTVQLLWQDTQVPESMQPPWSPLLSGDTPAGWQARLGDPGTSTSIGSPLLVTLGRTDADLTVMANLGAMGHLAVSGQPDHVHARLRAATMEIATSTLSGIVEIAVSGDDALDLDNLSHVQTFDRSLEAITAEIARDVVVADRMPRLLVAHHDTAAASELPEDPHHLSGQLLATDSHTGWVLRVEADRGTLVFPDGAELCLTLPDLDPQLIVNELERLDAEPLAADGDVETIAHSHPSARHREHGDTDIDEAVGPALDDHLDTGTGDEVVVLLPPRPSPAWCEVHLLGPVGAAIDGTPILLPPQSQQLLVCLATASDGLTIAQLEDRVWAGQMSASGSRRVRQALHRLRTQLGDGPDDEPLLPRRTDASSSRVRLSPHVGTDWDRASSQLEAARETNGPAATRHLAAALELVRGPVLDGLTVDWATRLEQEILAALQDAAVAAAQAFRAAGDLDKADWAVRQGLELAVYEPLYIEWAEIENARGRVDQVRRIFRHLETTLAADDDATNLPIGPTKATQLAFKDLLDVDTDIQVDH